MTIRTSPPITLTDVLVELRRVNPNRALPIGLGDADVRNLAGKPSGAISLSDLYGKSSYIPMTANLPDVEISGTANNSVAYTQTGTVTISFQGGTAPYSISWVHISGSGTVDNVNSTSTTVRMPVPRLGAAGQTTTQVVQCAIVDSTGAQIVRQCTVTMTLV